MSIYFLGCEKGGILHYGQFLFQISLFMVVGCLMMSILQHLGFAIYITFCIIIFGFHYYLHDWGENVKRNTDDAIVSSNLSPADTPKELRA